MKPARAETCENAITGVLTRRVALFQEAEEILDRLAEIKDDIGARSYAHISWL